VGLLFSGVLAQVALLCCNCRHVPIDYAVAVSSTYLQHFPKPLLDDLVNGRWLPVIGAGMSLNAELPPPAKMPLWSDLSDQFAKELLDYTPTGVLDAISAYEHEFGRARLIERLADMLHLNRARPGRAHREFCTLPFDIVCTTNFDFLLEKEYDRERQDNRSIHPVVDEDQLSINVGAAGTLLLKLHGDIRHPKRLVVTESDYDGFLANYPLIATYLANQLITKTAVFVGYSLDDPDFRQIWQVVLSRLGKTRRMAYAIVVNARQGDTARFERRGVKVVSLPGPKEKYGDILADAFAELREYRRDNAAATLKPADEKPLEQLLLPRDAATRLCFFSVPIDLLPFYRERVFPIAEEIGFVPVAESDVINIGDSIAAKIDTLIDRSAAMVADIGAPKTRADYSWAVSMMHEASHRAARRPLRIITVLAGALEGDIMREYLVVTRPFDLTGPSSDWFVEMLKRHLEQAARDIGLTQNDEPRRLFDNKEYRAAVISAMTLLEILLRKRQDGKSLEKVRRTVSFRELVTKATDEDLQPLSRDDLLNWSKLRNEVVHSARAVSEPEAKAVVEGVELILQNA
jgi:hypothetical protein